MQVTEEFNISQVYNFDNTKHIQSVNTSISNIDLSSKHQQSHAKHNLNKNHPHQGNHSQNINLNTSQTQDDTFWSFNNS